MANFSEKQIQGMIADLKDEFGTDIATRELALLELEDLKRKGCTGYAFTLDQCRVCSMSNKCPMLNWQDRHPEYVDDELAMKIRVLEAGGEEAYKAKLKAQEEAKKKAEEEAQLATDADRVNACRHLLNLFYKSKLSVSESEVLDSVNNILYAKTKAEICLEKCDPEA